jgi:hypothetical protein
VVASWRDSFNRGSRWTISEDEAKGSISGGYRCVAIVGSRPPLLCV